MSVSKVSKTIKEVVSTILDRVELPQDTKYKVKDFKCDIVFTIDGEEQLITVNHNGAMEVFTVAIGLDKKGNIDISKDNEKNTFVDKYVRHELLGESLSYEVIESSYADEDLTLIDSQEADGVKECIYEIKGSTNTLIRYYKDGNLHGEVEMK